jgi:L-asparaginase
VTSLPRVDIIYGSQEFDGRLLDAALALGDVKGLVLASPNGGVGADAAIARVAGQIPIVRHVRINVGMIAPSENVPTGNSTISSGESDATRFNPHANHVGLINNQKSRIQLMLALATGANPRQSFEEPLRTILYGK